MQGTGTFSYMPAAINLLLPIQEDKKEHS